ncbi:MAG: xanthine dehydrogenase family protein molybdopterin-binding subunit [Proteobacteria bacterium]|nr:xanthine dehydrogenase family protein molybdopterin-binding subunit [Pseudomonadota bacterium]
MSSIDRISRREFLKRTGQAGGGIVLALSVTTACQPAAETTTPMQTSDGSSIAANVYVNIRDDGIVEIYCHRSEMGQGIRTCLPQVIADELEADWDKVKLIQALGDEKYGSQNTDGSTSIRRQFDMLRKAGASAREMLITAAAGVWQVSVDECVARDHAIHHESSGRSLGYGELVAHAADIEVPEDPVFKSPDDYKYIGKSMDNIDGLAMSTGQANYGIDTTLPNMLYASIERCPVYGGSVKSLDSTAARAVTGVIDVISMPEPTSPPFFNPLGGVAVLASNTWSAQQGRAALEIEWDLGPNAQYDSEKYREELMASCCKEGTSVLNRGDAEAGFVAAESTHSAEYYAPHLAQAPMEPPAATAQMNEDGSCDVWSCTQNPQSVQETVAGVLGIEKEQVHAYVTLLGGGFGRKSKGDFAAEAAWLARATGRPVHVTWTREDDIRHGYYHSVSAQHLKAGMDENGTVTSWLHRSAFPSIGSTFSPDSTGPGGFELGLGLVDNPYAIPNMRLETGDAKAYIRIGWLRSVCNVYHAFAVGSFVDELAHLAGEDPKDYLLALLGPARKIDPAVDGAQYGNYGQSLDTHPIDTGRIAAVLEKVADMAGWGRELAAGHGLGIAVHRSFLTTVGTVAEVSVDDSGKLRVHELWTAIDAGRVINPDRVTAQMEGAGIFGMSLTMYGEITAKNGAVVQGNFDTYPVIRMNEAPTEINVHIMDVDAPPGGVGEPGVPPVAPAIVNAYFAASGNRVRELPLRNAGLS